MDKFFDPQRQRHPANIGDVINDKRVVATYWDCVPGVAPKAMIRLQWDKTPIEFPYQEENAKAMETSEEKRLVYLPVGKDLPLTSHAAAVGLPKPLPDVFRTAPTAAFMGGPALFMRLATGRYIMQPDGEDKTAWKEITDLHARSYYDAADVVWVRVKE